MKNIREAFPNKFVGSIRIMLGIIFIMTGIMKLTLPEFGAAWSIQLIEARIPFYTLNYWFVPIIEIIMGLIILVGYYSRIGALIIFPVMVVAIYVHFTVDNLAAFPAQPQEPYIPIAIIIMASIIVKKGSGNWSLDLKSSDKTS